MRDLLAVAHLVTAAPPPEVQRRLDVLRAAPAPARSKQHWLHLGPGATAAGAWVRVHAPAAWLRAVALRRALRALLRDGPRTVILHAWSRAATEWALPLRSGERPLLVEYDGQTRAETLAGWARGGALGCVCDSVSAAETLRRAGLAARRCVVIRPPVSPPAERDAGGAAGGRAALRAAVRARLRLEEDDRLVALVPPLLRGGGSFVAAWAALLLEKVESGTRLVLTADGAEAERVRYLIGACQHERMFRVAPPAWAWDQLAAAADLAVWSPGEASATVFAAEAVRAGCKVVATRMPVACELLGANHPWLCRPSDPQDAAATMLRALHNPSLAGLPAPGERDAFAPEQVISSYLDVYARLAARRPAGSSERWPGVAAGPGAAVK